MVGSSANVDVQICSAASRRRRCLVGLMLSSGDCQDAGVRRRTSTMTMVGPFLAMMSSSRCPMRMFCPRIEYPLFLRSCAT